MICKSCGEEIMDSVKFCPECGNAVGKPTTEVVVGEVVENSMNQGGEETLCRAHLGYNIGHLGVFLFGILTLVSVFLKNKAGAYVSTNSVLRAIEVQGKSSMVLFCILVACVVFTIVMAYKKKNILMAAGSVASGLMVRYMFAATEEIILHGMGYLLFIVSGILLVVSAVGALIINYRKRRLKDGAAM